MVRAYKSLICTARDKAFTPLVHMLAAEELVRERFAHARGKEGARATKVQASACTVVTRPLQRDQPHSQKAMQEGYISEPAALVPQELK